MTELAVPLLLVVAVIAVAELVLMPKNAKRFWKRRHMMCRCWFSRSFFKDAAQSSAMKGQTCCCGRHSAQEGGSVQCANDLATAHELVGRHGACDGAGTGREHLGILAGCLLDLQAWRCFFFKV